MNVKRRCSNHCAAALPLLGLLATSASWGAEGLEEVVVTATKQEATAAQETPLSLTVLSTDDLAASHIDNVRSLGLRAPSLVFANNGQWAQLYMRGIGSNNVFPGSDPSTTMYLDGVYLARPLTAFADFLDVERIEVLRGPQGTLYGRNSAGGVINIIARQPTQQPRVSLGVEYGEYEKFKVTGSASGPVVGDTLLGGIALMRSGRDGYVDNVSSPGSPARLNDEDSIGARGVLRLLASKSVEVSLSADYFSADDHASAGKPFLADVHGDPIMMPPAFTPTHIADPWTVSTTADHALEQKTTTWGVAGRVQIDLPHDMQLVSLSAYRELDFDNTGVDPDWTEVNALTGNLFESQHQFSQELQLTGASGGLKWLTGVYYLTEDDSLLVPSSAHLAGLILFGTPDLMSVNDAYVETEAWAVYANGTYALTDKLSISAGVRYSDEEKSIDTQAFLLVDGVNPGFGGFARQDRDDWQAWTPKLGVDYRWTDDRMVYASVTRGFKSGGFNALADQGAFEPEYIRAYEVGIKSDWLDNRLRANASAFYYDYTDLQVQTFQDPTEVGGVPTIILKNAASATVQGVELELDALPLDELRLSAGVAFLDATFDEFVTARGTAPDVPIDASGNTLSNAPKWAYSLSARYELALSDHGTLAFFAGYKWQDEIFFTQFNDPGNRQDSYGLLNAQIDFETSDGRWQFSVFGANLTDEVYYTGTTDFSPFGVVGYITAPRTVGAKVLFRN